MIHVALFAVGSGGKEDAVLAGLFFDETVAETNAVRVFSFKILGSEVEGMGHTGDFLFTRPDVSFVRPGAAATTLAAGKGQTGLIPGIFFRQTLHGEIVVKGMGKFK